jgi:phenylpropionate dioxygenase-like ring-hydroxylating dioxygenase large terminal subunit
MHLPVEAYTSQEWFDREQEQIFGTCWQFAGFVEDVAERGDVVTAQAGRFNIIVVRGEDTELRAFHNMCRHRGTQLLRTAGKSRTVITCPYHDWTYSLDGELIGVPQGREEFACLDKSTLSLHGASVAT